MLGCTTWTPLGRKPEYVLRVAVTVMPTTARECSGENPVLICQINLTVLKPSGVSLIPNYMYGLSYKLGTVTSIEND